MKKRYLFFISYLIYILSFIFLGAFASIEAQNILTPKMLKELKIMENRHFKSRSDNGENEKYRLERLEIELMGKSWENLSTERRMERLKIASQKRMLQGTSIPPSLSRNFTAKRIHNDSIEVVSKNDDVGIIDGLMRLYAPELFQAYRAQKERQFEIFSD